MINKKKTISRYLALFGSWLIFPPLFLVLSIIWKTPKLIARVILTFLSPVSLILLLVISYYTYSFYCFFITRGSRAEIETKTEVKFPEYKTIERKHIDHPPSFNGDFSIEYSIKLDTNNIKGLYNRIDMLILNRDTLNNKNISSGWTIEEDGNFHFSHMENNDEDDQYLELNIDKKTALVKIKYGRY